MTVFQSLSQKPPHREGGVSFLAVHCRMLHIPEIHLIHLIKLFCSQYSVFVTDSSDMGGCECLMITLSSRVSCLSIRDWTGHGSVRRRDALLLKNTPTGKGIAGARESWATQRVLFIKSAGFCVI